MGKKLTLVCILAVAVALAVPAFAEVQDIKVSGDITVRGLSRINYDLDDNDNAAGGDNPQQYFMQSVGLNFDADLTDNVATSVRLINQRDWDNNSDTTEEFDVALDLAYVTLKEMIYAPLTLKLGRQDLWFGRGFIIGANLQDFQGGTIGADEYTETSAFDAIRATLDYAPWTIDLVYSKIDENTLAIAGDDVTLAGANVGYTFDAYDAETEAYLFSKVDGNATTESELKVYTAGLRGSLSPIENLTIGAEGAYQLGDYSYSQLAKPKIDIDAWAFNVYADYAMPDITWTPKLGLEFIYLSGEDDTGSGNQEYNGWDAMYRGKFDTAIRDFQNYLYATSARQVGTGNTMWDQDSGLSNQLSLLFKGSVVPMEDVTVKGTYGHFWLEEKPNAASTRGVMTDDDDVGDEIDLLLTYDYTEDVSFGLLAGWFIPGGMYPSGQDDTATDVVGSMKVVF